MLIATVLLVLMAFAFFYVFRGYAVLLVLGAPALGLAIVARGGDNRDIAVGIMFFIVCWFIWVFRKGLRS